MPPIHTPQRVPNRSSKPIGRAGGGDAALTGGTDGGGGGVGGNGGGAADASGVTLAGLSAAAAARGGAISADVDGVAGAASGGGSGAGAGTGAGLRGSCARANSSARSRSSTRRTAPICESATTNAAMAMDGIASAASTSMRKKSSIPAPTRRLGLSLWDARGRRKTEKAIRLPGFARLRRKACRIAQDSAPQPSPPTRA